MAEKRKVVSLLAMGFGTLLLWATLCFTVVSGAAFMSRDQCPEGVAKGETWIPEVMPGTSSPAGCMSCTCFKDPQVGYSCYSCGVAMIGIKGPGCYVDKATPDLPYPQCCALEQLCPGDQGYNASKAPANTIG